MEEDGISRFHLEMHAWRVRPQVQDAVIELVHSALPLRVTVLKKPARGLVTARLHHEATVAAVHPLQRCPRAHDAVGGAEREVVQILVQRVA